MSVRVGIPAVPTRLPVVSGMPQLTGFYPFLPLDLRVVRCSSAGRGVVVIFFSRIFLTASLRARASSRSARLIVASAGLMRLRDKRVQKIGSHEHTVRIGSDWPPMANTHQLTRHRPNPISSARLLSTKRVNRIHVCCAQRRDEAAHDGDDCQQKGGASESHRIPRLEAEQQRAGSVTSDESQHGAQD
jgi:hypothetical protein